MTPDTVSVTRELLYEQVWSMPMMRLAKDYGVSGNALAKTCRKLGVPVPPRGFWAKRQHGRKVPSRPPLPPVENGQRSSARVTRSPPARPPELADPAVAECAPSLASEENRIRVADELRNLHPAIRAPRADALTGKASSSRQESTAPPSVLPVTVGKEHDGRALRILDALVKALEARGYPVTAEGIMVEGQRVQLAISEKQDRTPHVPTAAEEKEQKLHSWKRLPLWDYQPNGLLSIHADNHVWWRRDLRKRWSDTRHKRLEDMLDDVLLGLVALGVALRQRRDEQRAEAERQAELVRQRREKERFERMAAAQSRDIVARAKSLADADVVRRLIEAVEASGAAPSLEREAWLDRARAIAASLDPLSDGLERMLARHEEVAETAGCEAANSSW